MFGTVGCATTEKGNPNAISSFGDYKVSDFSIKEISEISWPEGETVIKEDEKYFCFTLDKLPALIKAQTLSELIQDQNVELRSLIESKDIEIYNLVEGGISLEAGYQNQQEQIQDLQDQTGLDKWFIRGLIAVGVLGFARP